MSLFTKLFGGSRKKNNVGNHAYGFLQDSLGGSVGNVGNSSNAISAMLGLGGDPAAQRAAFDNFKNSTGYQFLMDSGTDAITGNRAARGLLRSGSAGKALTGYAQNLANTTYGDYMDRLFGLGQMGLGAAGVLSDAGKYDKGKASEDTGGLGKFIGSIFASERRLKQNIDKIGELSDGLGIYEFEYKSDPGIVHVGTMVEEVEQLRPWALGPLTEEGYKTVDYSKLGDA